MTNKIIKAGKALINFQPFYGFFLLSLQKKYLKRFPTYGAISLEKNTGIMSLIFNPDMVEKLTDKETMGLALHEIMHVTNNHLFSERRMPNHELANQAQDFFINSEIIQNLKMELPKDGLFPANFGFPELKTSQWYYDELSKKKAVYDKNKKNGIPNPGNSNKSSDEPWSGTPQENLNDLFDQMNKGQSWEHHWEAIEGLSDIEKEVLKQKITDGIVRIAKEQEKTSGRGTLPAGIKELLDNLKKFSIPAANWKKLLKRQLTGYPDVTKRITRKRPSKRFSNNPGSIKNRKNKILFGIDTSGSMGQKDIAEAFSELHHVWKAGAQIDVIEIDTEINAIYKYEGKVPKFITGRGGTNLSPAIKYMNDHIHQYSMLLLLTDGYHERPKISCPKPVIHLVTTEGSDDDFKDLPYRTIKMKNNE